MHLLGKHVQVISHFEGTLLVLLVLQQTERRSAHARFVPMQLLWVDFFSKWQTKET